MCGWGAAASGAASASSPASGGIHGLLLQLAAHLAQPSASAAACPQDVANMWWALAAAGVHPDTGVLKGLEAALVECMGPSRTSSSGNGSHWKGGSTLPTSSASSGTTGFSRGPTSSASSSCSNGIRSGDTGACVRGAGSGSNSGRANSTPSVHIQKEELGQVMWAMVKLHHCPTEACVHAMVDTYLADCWNRLPDSLDSLSAPRGNLADPPDLERGTQGSFAPAAYCAGIDINRDAPVPAASAVSSWDDLADPNTPRDTSTSPASAAATSPNQRDPSTTNSPAHPVAPQAEAGSRHGRLGAQAPTLQPTLPILQTELAGAQGIFSPGDIDAQVPAYQAVRNSTSPLQQQQHATSSTPATQQYTTSSTATAMLYPRTKRRGNPQSAAHMLWGLARLHHRPRDSQISGLVGVVVA